MDLFDQYWNSHPTEYQPFVPQGGLVQPLIQIDEAIQVCSFSFYPHDLSPPLSLSSFPLLPFPTNDAIRSTSGHLTYRPSSPPPGPIRPRETNGRRRIRAGRMKKTNC
ncbi:hypothetical protein RO3G_13766 [Rhizopus delemar RA 99-880]|uniref:Uncharacterized protein n=1 Tax=Rhizopus delemar (strain RA 99-880 / ATCC MYA-4621 / FGSC 9543 / NRRL 43880) TaxID=246409 RepID=I1CKS5_RHIO9|nr:hypothetical protein RO3G_13766 [Rhizopus delemar RA 99-880]|eukprot:EIE89055.1 hypothetical protein RO3G_13766 [Rhizopus delemar RA 99-880]